MRQIVTVLACALAVGCARPAYLAKSDAENAWMTGGVRQIRETLFDSPANPDALPDTLAHFDTYTVTDYNRAGNITLMESFRGPDSTLIAKEEYFYDPSGERLERGLTHNLARRGVVTILYDYDEHGGLTSERESNDLYRFDYRNNRRGYPKAQITTSPESGKQVVIQRYRYDSQGRLKRLRGERNQKYDYHPSGVIAEVRTGKSALDRYNDHGDLEAMAVRIDRKDLIKGRTFEGFWMTLSARYEYDERGNWTKRTMLHRDQVQSIALRQISYWDE